MQTRALLNELFLITVKPVLYVANVDEDGLSTDNDYTKALEELAGHDGSEVIKYAQNLGRLILFN